MATIQEKPLARKNPNNPQIKEYVEAIERGKDTLHIFPTESGWTIKKIGGTPLGVSATREKAVSAAEELRTGTVTEIITHDENGLITARLRYSKTLMPPQTQRSF